MVPTLSHAACAANGGVGTIQRPHSIHTHRSIVDAVNMWSRRGMRESLAVPRQPARENAPSPPAA
eukprot:4926234-Prymnesium_polylepis.2